MEDVVTILMMEIARGETFDQWHSMLVGLADGVRHFIVLISFVDPCLYLRLSLGPAPPRHRGHPVLGTESQNDQQTEKSEIDQQTEKSENYQQNKHMFAADTHRVPSLE